jgi:BirA family transcriptional regulator, biotin operon repressor / biotin---[acetyl-CoA-carboxylase] ligase
MSSMTRRPKRAPLSATTLRAAVLSGSRLFTSLEVVDQTGSTNADLLAAARTGADGGAVLVAEEQTAGRGRLDRSWQSQPGAALTFSVLLRPTGVPPAYRGWLPLLTGVATASALRAATGVAVSLKWPNDVLGAADADGRAGKLAGILAEQAGDAIVVGIGLNVSAERDELPSDQATSLWLEGAADLSRDGILIDIARELEVWYLRWTDDPKAGEAQSSGLHAAYCDACSTIGREVRVELPGGGTLTGQAVGVDGLGRLVLSASGGEHAVSAGDVVHVRPAS